MKPNQTRKQLSSALLSSSRAIGLALSFGLTLLLQDCSPANSLQNLNPVIIAQTPPPEGIIVNFCTDPATQVQPRVKYLIILDHSGSNQNNYRMDTNGNPLNTNGQPITTSGGALDFGTQYATDSDGSLRYGDPATPGTLLNFLYTTAQQTPSNGNKFFSLIDFSSGQNQFPADHTFTSTMTTPTKTGFYDYVAADKGTSPSDGGSTSYTRALESALTTISTDITNAENCAQPPAGTTPTSACPTPGQTASSDYVIVFMSDGSPITNFDLNALPFPTITRESSSDILTRVSDIMSLKATHPLVVDAINLFTVYYYFNGNPNASPPLGPNIDPNGQSLLQQMANTGGGAAYSAVSGSSINFKLFTPPAKLIKNSLADVFVTNSNITFWTDPSIPNIPIGVPLLDSDGDGLPDVVENYLGSDPFNSDSDGNGVSDFVEYSINNRRPCKTLDRYGHCSITGSIHYENNLCSGPSFQVFPFSGILDSRARPLLGALRFNDSDKDGLNDCEENLFGNLGGFNNPDSNADLIPDWLEFKNGIYFQLGSPSASSLLDSSSYNGYNKIKFSLPVNYPYHQIIHPQPASYNLVKLTSSPVQDCYQLTVKNLPVVGVNNQVRVDIQMKDPYGNLISQTGKKKFSGSSLYLNFNDWNDVTESQLKTWTRWPQP